MANSLYLEWFSAANGGWCRKRGLQADDLASSWRLTSDEEKQRRHEAALGF